MIAYVILMREICSLRFLDLKQLNQLPYHFFLVALSFIATTIVANATRELDK